MPVSSPWPGHRSGEDAAEATKPIRNRRSGCVYGWDVGVIDLTARYGINDFETLTLQTSPTVRSEARYQEDGSSGEFGAVFTRPLGSRLTSEPHFIHDFSDDNGVSNSRTTLSGVGSPEQGFASDSKASETILRTLVRFEQSANLTWESGGEIAYNMLEADQAFSNGGVLVPLASASVKVEETRGEVFGLGAWRLRDNLTVESGVRVEGSTINQSGDADSEKAFSFIKPRLLATWTPWTNNQFRVRFEREVGQLDFNAFAASAELQNENVLGGNIGDATLDRLSVNIQAPLDRFGFAGGRISARNTWNHTEVIDPTTGKTRPLSNVPKSHAVIVIGQDIESLDLQWSAAWVRCWAAPATIRTCSSRGGAATSWRAG